MAADELRVAVIGFGLGGRVFHAPLVDATPGLRVATIVTADPGRQAAARARYPGAEVAAAADAVWSAAGDHDLVVITTPNVAHVPLALAAFSAGLPVVLDKPMAPSAAEGEQLVADAAQRGLLLSVFQNRRWDGDFLTVRRLLDGGAVGPVVRFESRFERWRPERDGAAWRELGEPAEAGGLLFDLGSHLIDQAVVLFGRPTSVYAEVDRRRAGAEVDDDTFVALAHPGGERSHLWCSVTARLLGPRLRVLGLEGAYEKHGLDPQEAALASGADPSAAGWGREAEEHWGTLADAAGERAVETEAGAYPAYYAGIAAALRDGSPPPVDPRDSIDGLRVIEAAARSARDGVVVELDWEPDR
jgi:scyllo-inositol 2-dehydrogenase (NADP+)